MKEKLKTMRLEAQTLKRYPPVRPSFYRSLRMVAWVSHLLLIAWVMFAVFQRMLPASTLFSSIFFMTFPLWITFPGMLKGSLSGSFWGAVVMMFYMAISVMEVYASPTAGVFPWVTAALAGLVFLLAVINIAGFKLNKAAYKKHIEKNQ